MCVLTHVSIRQEKTKRTKRKKTDLGIQDAVHHWWKDIRYIEDYLLGNSSRFIKIASFIVMLLNI